MTVYVAHKGEDVVAIGTRDEVADKLGVNTDTVRFWSSPHNHKLWRESKFGNRMVVDRVEL